mgnify:CR=1 FL=1
MYELYRQHPEYFVENEYGNYVQLYTSPRAAKEQVDAGYVEFNTRWNQLRLNAGLRHERHLILYLASRVLAPIGLGLFAFVYISTIYGTLPPQMRIAAAAIGMVIGNYLPFVMLRNLISRRQTSIRRAWPDSLDLMLICVESGMAIEPAMQHSHRQLAQRRATRQCALGWKKTLRRKVMALQAVLGQKGGFPSGAR